MKTIDMRAQKWERWGWGVLLVVSGLVAYSNCFQGEFVFDDNGGILGNPHITHLWPLSEALSAPSRTSTAGRPTVCLSIALNYAFCGLQIWGYRAVNLGIHLAAGLLFFGLVRRTIGGSERLRTWADGHFSALAFWASMFWVLHPLNTQVVNYTIQRCESIMGLFYLLTLYAAVRSWNEDGSRRMVWQVVAIVACALGMGSKEVMVSAPLMVLIYDTTFVSGSFLASLRRSRFLYAGLALTWAVLGFLVAQGGTANGARQGKLGWSAFEYALTQSEVILHYLRLAFWPKPLCFDYGWPVERSALAVWPSLCAIALLLAGTIWAVVKRPEIGFLAVWFFVLLGPTSSVLPLPDMAVEYRTYLALAAVPILCVVTGYSALKKLSDPSTERRPLIAGAAVCALAAVSFGLLTFERNIDYHSAIAVWRDTAVKRPLNARAHANLGIALASARQFDDAEKELRIAEQIDPHSDSLHLNLGCILAMKGRTKEAALHFEEAVKETPDNPEAYYNLANALSDLGRKTEASQAYVSALKLRPDFRDAHFNFAVDLQQRGKVQDAATHLAEVLRIDPNYAPAHSMLGMIFARANRRNEAIQHLLAALALNPEDANVRAELSRLRN